MSFIYMESIVIIIYDFTSNVGFASNVYILKFYYKIQRFVQSISTNLLVLQFTKMSSFYIKHLLIFSSHSYVMNTLRDLLLYITLYRYFYFLFSFCLYLIFFCFQCCLWTDCNYLHNIYATIVNTQIKKFNNRNKIHQ